MEEKKDQLLNKIINKEAQKTHGSKFDNLSNQFLHNKSFSIFLCIIPEAAPPGRRDSGSLYRNRRFPGWPPCTPALWYPARGQTGPGGWRPPDR